MPSTPPLAPGFPLLGNALDLLRDPLGFFLEMYHELGPVFRVNGAGREYVVLAGVEANQRFREWEDESQFSGPVYRPYVDDLKTDQVLIGMDGERHRAFRKWLRPGFSREAVAPHLQGMVKTVESFISELETGQELNVTDVMQFLIAQMSGIALAGCPIDGHFDDAKRFAHTFLGAGVGSFPGFMRLLPRYRLARKRFFGFLEDVIDSHRQGTPTNRPPDLIDLLIRTDPPSGGPLTETDILASAHMPYTNSLVYVAATCGFMLFELLRDQDLLEKVQAEVDQLFAEGAPTMVALRRSKWLRGALLETQRLHPIAVSLPRYVQNNFEFEGYLIEAGSLTLTATAVTHFLPEYFPNPHEFDVSRYFPPRVEHRQAGVLVPFGLGPHVCLSAGVVNAFCLLAIGTLLQRLEFQPLPADAELNISVAPFPAPNRNFKVTVADRREMPGIPRQPSPERSVDLDDILPEVDASSLTEAVERAETRRYEAGTVIIRQGETADEMFIIASGGVEVLREGAEGEVRIVARLGAGDYFGEIGLVQQVPRTASVRAESALEAIVLDRQTFMFLVAETDLTSGEIAAVMRRRLISTTLAAALPKLDLDQVAEISPHSELVTYKPGEIIIRQGDPADNFYAIVQGQVDVINEHPDGRQIFLNTLGEGEYFGEIGLIQGRPRNATVKAGGEGEVVVLTLDRDVFLATMAESDATNAQVALRMAERLSQLISARES